MLTAVTYAIVILSTIWVIIDSRRNQIPFGKEAYSSGHTFLWLVICIVLWIVGFPVYLFKRAKTLKARNPEASGSPLAFIFGGLAFAVALLCIAASFLMAIRVLTINGGRLSDAALSKQVADAIERQWRETPASANVHMKEVSLHHTDGNDYDGVVTADVSGQTKQYAAHVTYDGKTFSYKVAEEIAPAAPATAEAQQPSQSTQSPEDKLKSLVAKNILATWKLDPATKGLRLKDLTLQHESGDRYTGIATADDAGQEKRFPLQVTYDSAHNNLSVQTGDEVKRMSDEELRVEIREAIEKKWRATPQSQDVHMKDITLSHQGGNDYTGVVTALVSGEEENFTLKVTYDGSHWNYEVGDQLPLSVNQLRDQVGATIEKKWRENPKSQDVHFKSMTLEDQGGGEYLGFVTADVSGTEEKHVVHVHYDGKNWTYKVE